MLFRGWYADPYNTTMVNVYNQAVPSLPETPAGLSATAGNAVVNLSWNAVTGTGIFGSGVYNIKRSSSSGGPYTTIASRCLRNQAIPILPPPTIPNTIT